MALTFRHEESVECLFGANGELLGRCQRLADQVDCNELDSIREEFFRAARLDQLEELDSVAELFVGNPFRFEDVTNSVASNIRDGLGQVVNQKQCPVRVILGGHDSPDDGRLNNYLPRLPVDHQRREIA